MLNGVNPATDLGAFSQALAITLGKLLAFVALMLVVGRSVVPAILHYIAHTGSRELFRLAVLSLALGVAFAAAELFGVSLAIGAFFAGMILSESPLSQRAAEESLPLRDAFAVLFFVSVGMLFNPLVVMRDPLALALTLLVVMVGGAGATLLIMRAFGYPLASALLVAAGLAQIGEFSYVLADFGIGLHMLPEGARDLILGTSIISICVNPLLLSAAEKMRRRLEPEKPEKAQDGRAIADEQLEPTRQSGHAIVVGYGRVGSLLGADLRKHGVPFLVIEMAQDIVERLRAEGTEVIPGNAATEDVLKTANLPGARLLFVAIPEAFEAGQIVAQARAANPRIEIVARAHFDAEVEHLLKYGANAVIMGEREIARAMLEYVGVAQPEVQGSADSA
jgi:CPA2 family monovalent cation:H+ antiporter-2